MRFCQEKHVFVSFIDIFSCSLPHSKSKGGPPEPSAKPGANPPWQSRKHYKSVPSKSSSSSTLLDLAESFDDGSYEPPANPSESSTSRSTSAAAQSSWVDNAWEPSPEELN